jgi:purine-binding chemotaxis protein CheW
VSVNPDEPLGQGVLGRKALFTTITPQHERTSPPLLQDIINQLATFDGEEALQLPDEWNPLVEKISTLLRDFSEKNTQYNEIWNEYNILSDYVNGIERERQETNAQYKDIHANFNALLDELRTERKCLSESFGRHQVPMALITTKSEIIYANNTFCTLLEIEQKEIEKGERLLIEFSDEEDEEVVMAPNGYRLGCTILSPPPVLPGAMYADSLVVLMGHKPRVGTRDLHSSYEEVLDLFAFPAVLIEKDFTITRANEAFYTFTDIDPGSRDLISDEAPIMAILHPAIDQVLRSQTSSQFEESLYKGESEQNVMVHLFSAGDRVLCVLVPINMNTHPALLVEALLQIHPGPVAIINEQFSIVTANEVFSELYGVPSQDLTNMQVHELGLLTMPADDLHHCLQDGAIVFVEPVLVSSSYGDEQFTLSLIPDDTRKQILLQLDPVKSFEQVNSVEKTRNEQKDVVIQTADVSTDKECIDELLSSSTLPIVLCDPSGKILAWSPSCAKAFFSPTRGEHYQEYLIPASEKTDTKPALVCNAQNTNQMFQIYTATLKGQKETVYMLVPIGEELHKINQLSDENHILSEKVLEYESKVKQIEKKQAIHYQEEEEIDIIVFSMGEEYYAMDVTMVREVVEMLPITSIPRGPPHMLGIINLRGEVTHVIDFARVLGKTSHVERDLQKIIVLPFEQTGGEHTSIIVDSVQSVTTISSKHVSSLGDQLTEQTSLHIKGIIQMSVQDVSESMTLGEEQNVPVLIIWLDMPAIIASIRR